jgi:hypothetical protein
MHFFLLHPVYRKRNFRGNFLFSIWVNIVKHIQRMCGSDVLVRIHKSVLSDSGIRFHSSIFI